MNSIDAPSRWKKRSGTWSERERSARLMLADLHRESSTLEVRIGNLRQKLAEEQKAVDGMQALRIAPEPVVSLPGIVVSPNPVVTEADRTVFLQRVAGRLADQRAHLLEQWQTLLRVQEEWRGERRAGAGRVGSSRPIVATTRTAFSGARARAQRSRGGMVPTEASADPDAALPRRLAGEIDRR